MLPFRPHKPNTQAERSPPSRNMDNLQGSNDNLGVRYSPHTLYRQSTTNCPCCDWPSGESSSSSHKRNEVNPYSLQAGSPSDLPDLYYDQNWPSPHSTTSSNMISTPPPDWQLPWYPTEPQYNSNYALCLSSPQQEFSLSPRQVARPIVPPINTNCNLKEPVPEIVQHSSVLFGHDDCGSSQQALAYSSPCIQSSQYKYTGASAGHPPPSALISLPNSPNISPSTISRCLVNPSSCPPQPPLKIHQPRPFRRIPIISLSDLASASEGLPVSSHSRPDNAKNVHGVHVGSGPPSSTIFSVGVLQSESSLQPNTQPFHTANDGSSSRLGETPRSKVIACPCGCAESYTFHY